MATETITARTGRMELDNGTDSEGNRRTVNCNITGLSKDGWDGDKFLAVVQALEPCLEKSVYGAVMTATASIMPD